MKILFVDSSRNGWGTEQHLVCLAAALLANGHTVSAVAKRGSPVARLLTERGIRTHVTAFRGGADPRGIRAIVNAIRSDAPDWIVTNRSKLYWTAWVLARAMGVGVAVFRHLPDIRSSLTRRVLPRLVDRFFVVSHFARANLVEQGAPASRIDVLYNPIDGGAALRHAPGGAELRRDQEIPESACVVGFVGRVEPSKGFDVLCETLLPLMARNPDVHFVCIGDGQTRDHWRAQAQQRGLAARCHFIGWTAQVRDYYSCMDVLVAPSIAPETFCRVVAEAQTGGVAVIGSAIGGIPETFLPGRSGLLVQPNDARGLGAAIERLVNDRELRDRFGAAGQAFAGRQFSSNLIAQQFVECLMRDAGGGIELVA